MKKLEIKNIDCHATLAMIEKRWGFPRRTLRALLGMTKNAQSGRSMIEMLGVLAIIGVLSVGGIAGYSKAMMKYRINKTIEQITLIAGNIRTFFANQGNYEALYDSSQDYRYGVIQKAKLVPEEMLTLDASGKITNITNAFGGDVDIDDVLDSKYFYIGIRDIPQDAFIELATHDWGYANVTIIGVMEDNSFCSALPIDVEGAIKLADKAGKSKPDEIAGMLFYFDVPKQKLTNITTPGLCQEL